MSEVDERGAGAEMRPSQQSYRDVCPTVWPLCPAVVPFTRVELAVDHKSCRPPDMRKYSPSATRAINAAARQYSASPCPC